MGVLALTASMLGGAALLVAAPAQAAPGDPFDPADPLVFVAQGPPMGLFTAQTSGEGEVSFTPEGPTSDIAYNAIAYRTSDNYIYGLTSTGNDEIPQNSLIRIGQDGAIERVGTDTYSLSAVATFGPDDGYYYSYTSVDGDLYLQVIDVDTGAVVRMTPYTGDPVAGADFAYADGYFWTMGNGSITRTDPATGVTDSWESPFPLQDGDQGGAAWTFGNGNLGFSMNASGTIYQVAVSDASAADPTFTLVATNPGPSTNGNDGTSSPGQPTDLSIVKTGPEAVVPGGTVTYTVTVTNNGPGNSSGYVMNDTVPASLTDVATDDAGCTVVGNDVTCNGGRLVAGDSVTYTITASVPEDVTDTVENSARVTANEEDPDPESNTSTVTSGRAELTLAKSAGEPVDVNGNGIVDAGDTIEFTFEVENTGQVPVTGITVDDPLIGAVTCPEDTLAVGAVQTCAADDVYTITQADVENGMVENTATATGTTPDGDEFTSPPSTTTTQIPPVPELSVVKTADADAVEVGQTITYSFLVTNTGNLNMTDVEINETSFSGTGELSAIECPDEVASLAPGDELTCTATYEVTQADIDSGELSNTATAGGTTPSGDPFESDPSTSTVGTDPAPELSVVKTSDADAVEVGQTITYSFLVTNTGNVTVTDPVINETSFSGTGELSAIECPDEVASLAPGDELTCTATYEVTQADIDSGELSNTATAGGTTPSGDPFESDPSTSTVGTDPAPELSLVKSADVTTLTDPGEVVTYSFMVTNTGNVTVTDVVVDEASFSGTGELSAIECPDEVASLAPGDDVTCTATYEVTQADIDSGELTNSATVTGSTMTGDPVESDSSTSTVTVDSDDPATPATPAPPAPVAGSGAPGGPGYSAGTGSLAKTGSDVLVAGLAVGLLLAVGGSALGMRRHLRSKASMGSTS